MKINTTKDSYSRSKQNQNKFNAINLTKMKIFNRIEQSKVIILKFNRPGRPMGVTTKKFWMKKHRK